MALFQSSVIKKELQLLNQTVIDEKWNEFVAHFGNLEIQQKIRGLKEEQYQGEFLDDLFVKVLGYTKPPKPNHNLVTEQKNETNSKKADGAIIVDEKVVGVIELKGTNTTDLEKVKDQAFLYKVNHPECIYVITSNFEKLRFYIENTVDFIEFNLFQLSKKEFSLLYICLSYESIKNNVPKHLKDESVSKESQITKQLYKDYSDFKQALFNNLVELNPQYDKLLLFKKTQKLLDRFLFIFFAEDRQLVPTNLIRRINLEWEDIVKVKRLNVSLYDRYKTYFNDLNAGATVTLPAFGKKTGDAITAQFEIFAYNGGLFMPDEVLDNVKIDDALLHKHSILLSDYDFESDVDVNILGHIFENSLNEIDEIKSEIEGQVIDKTKTKRKKDGVFYTPKYITKYIVDNTVGKLCTDKKDELKLNEEEYHTQKNIQTKTKKALLDNLTEYRNWLLNITICDPACGSGAFLNQALEYLIAEHRYIDELQAKLMGDSLILSDVEKSILENNIYGVDLNDESVEIAKLSLWLRTAQKGRKLNSLNNNIKCGNSLIDDPEVVGDKAFSWGKEFPEVFAKGGFDVIIGNPPYGVNFNEVEKKYLSNFDKSVPDFEIYIYFISLYRKILKINSILSYIFPNTFLSTVFGKKYRDELLSNISIYQIVDLSNDNTFVDASVRTCIFSFRNKEDEFVAEFIKPNNESFELFNKYTKSELLLNSDNLMSLFNQTNNEIEIINKIKGNNILSIFHEVSQGLIPYDKYRGHDEQTIKNRIWHSSYQKDETYKRELKGGDVNRYNIKWNGGLWISYGEWLAAPRKPEFFRNERILVREILADKLYCGFTNDEYYNTPSCINIIDSKKILDLRFTLCTLNSKLIGWFCKKVSPKANKGLFPKILVNDVKNIPLIEIDKNEQKIFTVKADVMIQLNNDLQEQTQKFLNLLKSDFNLEKPSKKIEEFYSLTWSEFEKELSKNKITLLGVTKDDWFDRFDRFKKKALELISQINQTDKEIDCMVYELYGLTEEEIQIVENS